MGTIMKGLAMSSAWLLLSIAAAPASAIEYKASSYPARAIAAQVGQTSMTIDGSTVACSSAFFKSNEYAAATTSLTLKAEYAGCTAFGFVTATVQMNSCDYTAEEPTKLGADKYTATVSVKCTTAGDKIRITASTAFGACEVEIGAQGPIQHLVLTNDTASGKVPFQVTLSGINAKVVKDTGICPLAGTGERTNVTTVGEFKAEREGGGSIFIE